MDIAVRQGSRGAIATGVSVVDQEEKIAGVEAELGMERRRVVANAREFLMTKGHINRRPQSTKEQTRHQVHPSILMPHLWNITLATFPPDF